MVDGKKRGGEREGKHCLAMWCRGMTIYFRDDRYIFASGVLARAVVDEKMLYLFEHFGDVPQGSCLQDKKSGGEEKTVDEFYYVMSCFFYE